jgi:CBS domain-containing protein
VLVAQILKEKGTQVFTCPPHTSLPHAAALLAEHRVGALVVVKRDQIVGIFSERDLVRALAKHGPAALDEPVEGYMTSEVIYARPQETVDEVMERMTDRRIRHLPVVEGETLIGIVSIGDVVKTRIAETIFEAETLKAYIVSG